MKRFEDKTILVTGAGSGIGAACVRRLFAEGASIVAADVRKEEVDKVVSEFGNSERIYGVGVDVRGRGEHADDGIGTRTAGRPRQCCRARNDPYADDGGHVPGPRKREADSRGSSHWSRRSTRRGRGSDCLPPV